MINATSKSNWSRLRAPLLLLSLMALTVVAMNVAGVRINWTASEPRGVYLVQPVSAGIERGDLIEFCYSGAMNRYMTHGVCPNGSAPFFKTAAAVPGDLVVVGDAGVLINGVMLSDSRPLSFSVSDPTMELPVLRGRFLLKPGQYWTYGSKTPGRSYDSRYFGPIDLAEIRSVSK